MQCTMTSRAAKRSHMMGPQSVPVGTESPCSMRAARTCTSCKTAVCNSHSRSLSTMGGKMENRGKRRCSNCGYIAPEGEWGKVQSAS